jgi:transposase
MELYTTGDIAAVLGVSRPTVSNWVARGYDGLPEPALRTVGGMGLWTGEQVEEIRLRHVERKLREAKVRALKEELQKLREFDTGTERA